MSAAGIILERVERVTYSTAGKGVADGGPSPTTFSGK